MFFGTSIATCILVLKRSKENTNISFVDASKEFIKVSNNNKLTEDNIKNILSYYVEKKDINYIAKQASYDSIVENNYNLSVSTYVEKEDTREKIDIKELNAKLKTTAKHIDELRKAIDEIIDEIEEQEE